MAEARSDAGAKAPEDLDQTLEDIEFQGRKHGPRTAELVGVIAVLWSLFQLRRPGAVKYYKEKGWM